MNAALVSEAAYDAQLEKDRTEHAQAQMAVWDARKLRQAACFALSTMWLGLGGQPLLPLGFLVAMMLLVPDVPGWSYFRRVRYTGRRVLWLAGYSLTAFLVGAPTLGLLNPDGSTVALVVRVGSPF